MRKRKKSRAKSIILDYRIWLRNAEEIKAYRDKKLKEQDGKCAILGIKPLKPVLDHTHKDGIGEDGRVRSVLESDVNLLEGRYLQLFKRAKIEEKYGITFPDFLISLGEYLKLDNTEAPFHHKYMQDFRKEVSRWNKQTLLDKLWEDYGIRADKSTLVKDLVQMYVQAWVYEVEKLF